MDSDLGPRQTSRKATPNLLSEPEFLRAPWDLRKVSRGEKYYYSEKTVHNVQPPRASQALSRPPLQLLDDTVQVTLFCSVCPTLQHRHRLGRGGGVSEMQTLRPHDQLVHYHLGQVS